MNKPKQAIAYQTASYSKLFLFLLLVLSAQWLMGQSSFQICAGKFESKRYDSALICFNQLAAQNPLDKENLYNRGICYYALKKYPEAMRDFAGCLVIDSNFKEAAWMLATAQENTGNYKKAYTIYQMLNTKYGGYNDSKKRVFYYRLSVILSKNWYYMLAIMFMVIIFVTVVAKTVIYKRG